MQLNLTGFIAVTLLAAYGTSASAYTSLTRKFVSESGKTTITIQQNSDWQERGAVIGEYKQVGGSGGILTNTGKDDPMGFYTLFRDTSGSERCVGRMHIFIDDSGRGGYGSQTTWQIDGSVPGFQCSTVGKTIRLNVRQYDWTK